MKVLVYVTGLVVDPPGDKAKLANRLAQELHALADNLDTALPAHEMLRPSNDGFLLFHASETQETDVAEGPDLAIGDAWSRYMGPYLTPEEYMAKGWSLDRLHYDLTKLWGDHPADALKPPQVEAVARRLAAYLEDIADWQDERDEREQQRRPL